MSSDLNKPSTNQPISSTDMLACSEHAPQLEGSDIKAASLITEMSAIIDSKLPVAKLHIDPASSPQLEKIVMQTSRIPDDTFQVLLELKHVVEDHESQLEGLRPQIQNNEPIADDKLKKHKQSFMSAGRKIFFDYHGAIAQHIRFVEKSWDNVNKSIRQVFDESKKTQDWQGRVDVIKDNLVPQVSAINPLLAPAESVANVAVGLAAYDISRKLDDKLSDLGVLDEALREDVLVAIKTKARLQEYLLHNQSARNNFEFICDMMYDIKVPGEGSNHRGALTSQRIDLAKEIISQLMLPVNKFLVQKNGYYGHGITVVREVDSFCDVIPKISQDIERIVAARVIIKRSHEARFGKTAHQLGMVIFQFLQTIKDIYDQKIVEQAAFFTLKTHKFSQETGILIHSLDNILDKRTSSRRMAKAKKIRKVEDRFSNAVPGPENRRALVNPDEVRGILRRLNQSVETIHKLAAASGIGKMVQSITGNEVERAHVEFDLSNNSLGEFHQVLGEGVRSGLEELEELLPIEEPKSFIGQIGAIFRPNR
ncbi:hypothetical protein AGABI1DRAFT_128745 [Agaricus bisporus var. burnettii JB137-S8]|uniref:Uncharacterized protein n=1 Tax=Agaricus bisporus var. burnettii (strain JB137-S8 / ATCC MYA-4627 / FGSC 10392) TaxID=597362 RepID=K5WVY2_AGABU|nr:uncharacterized protein AGABI1DRAFT_128745 [Agaricus bisporus var. burnettii JB137-S8]EKM79601.1 hypothetical protein AGABI1DRAFT_128745 [Agaricus bisporus var. burnettii JB137-S8]